MSGKGHTRKGWELGPIKINLRVSDDQKSRQKIEGKFLHLGGLVFHSGLCRHWRALRFIPFNARRAATEDALTVTFSVKRNETLCHSSTSDDHEIEKVEVSESSDMNRSVLRMAYTAVEHEMK